LTGWLATAAAMSHFFAARQRTTRVPKDRVAVLVLRRFKYQRRIVEHSKLKIATRRKDMPLPVTTQEIGDS
jgi:rRNA processing protein Krr1/Pno1